MRAAFWVKATSAPGLDILVLQVSRRKVFARLRRQLGVQVRRQI